LTVSGFTLNQLDSNFAATGSTGFNPDAFAYSVVTARTMEPVTATVTVTKSTYSTASYTIWGNLSNHLESGSLTDANSSLQLAVKPMQDSRVVITVKSGDGIATKSYQIFFQYPRTIQEGLKIGSTTWSTFENGQWIAQNSYHIQKGSVNGEKLIDTDTLLLYSPGETVPFLTCTYYSCRIPDESITGTAGSWDVKIMRNGTILAQGEYRYDLSIVPVLTGDIGLEAIPLTTQELIDALRNEPSLTTPLRFGYNVFVDSAKLQALVPGAKYYNIGAQDMIGTVNALPAGLSKEEYKIGIQPNGYHGYSMSQAYSFSFGNPNAKQQTYGAYYHRSDSPDEDKSINDMFVYVGIYDENLQLLGQFITTLTFDQAHVADGYTPSRNWVPSQP